MKRFINVGAMTCAVAATMLVGFAAPAQATNGNIDVKRYGPEGGGSHAQSYIHFPSEREVYWYDLYLNDLCPSDGRVAILRRMVRYEGDSGWTQIGGDLRDTGGCGSLAYRQDAAYHDSVKRINDATVVACVEGAGCSSANDQYRDNPRW